MRNRLRTTDKKDFLWLIPVLIILLPFILILTPIEYFSGKKRKRLAKQYLADNLGKSYFFYTNKHGWGDFIKNNVLPILHCDTQVYNIYQDKDNPLSMIYDVVDITKTPWTDVTLPFIINLSSPTLKVLTLHKDFNTAKKTPKRNSSIQADLKKKINEMTRV